MEFKICDYPHYIYLRNGKTITHYWKRNDDAKEIKFNDLFDNNNYKQEIHITRKNQEIHAVLKENDKVIKHTVAKCHPEDEFDFKVGSKLAYGRLFEEDNKGVNTNKSKHEFKVGDKVRIRQWDDMLEEFELNKCGNINVVTDVFSSSMKYLCGKIATIDALLDNHLVCLDFHDKVLNDDYWNYTTEMLEPYTPRIAKVGEYVKILENGKIAKCVSDTEYNGEKIFGTEECDCIPLKSEEYEVLDDYIPPLNCKFVVLKDVWVLTKGKIYEIKNGKFKCDDGIHLFPTGNPIKDEEDLKEYFGLGKYNEHRKDVYSTNGVEYVIIQD